MEKNNGENYNGIIVRLFRKLAPNHSRDKNQHFKYLVWSYFDGMSFEKVADMSEFYLSQKKPGPQSNLSRFYEEQHINLYPSPQEDNDASYCLCDEENSLDFPLISLTEIKVSDNDIAEGGLDTIENKIRKAITNEMSERKDMFIYQIYRSFGYGEFVVIARSASYGHIFDMISILRALDETWSTYTILGVHRKYDTLKHWDDLFYGSVSIRLTISPEGNFGIIWDKLKKLFKNDTELVCYEALGKYDFEITIGNITKPVSTRKVVDLFHTGIFNTNHKIFKNNILVTHTRWLYKYRKENFVTDLNATKSLKNGSLDSKSLKNGTLDNYNKIYKNRLENHLPETLRLPFKEILYSYERLIQSFYNRSQLYEMKKIIETLFYLMLESVGYDHDTILKLLENEDSKIKAIKTHKLLDAGNIARTIDLLSDYMMDMLHSSRPFFEIMNQNVKFSGYIAKIIMAYSSIIDAVEADVESCINSHGTENDLHSNLNFFLSVHISHEVDSFMLFPNSSKQPRKRLIAIRCDTTSLFNVKHAICFLMHEIGHFIPPKSRIGRNMMLLEITCEYTARLFVGSLFSAQMIISDQDYEKRHMLFKDYPSLQKPFERTIKTFKDILLRILQNEFKENPNMSGVLINFTYFLKNNFFGKFMDDKEWAGILEKYKLLFEEEFIELYKYWSKYIHTTLPKVAKSVRKTGNNDNDPIEEVIQKIAHTLMHEGTKKNKEKLMYCLHDFMNESRYQQYIRYFIERVRKHISEVSADVFMCCVLGLNDADYMELVTGYARRLFGVSLKDNIKDNNIGYASLYSRIFTVINLLSKDGNPARVGNPTIKKWLSKPILNIVSQYNNTIGQKIMNNYLTKLMQFYNNNLSKDSGIWENIKNLKKEYMALNCCSPDLTFKRQASFIETFWELGLNRCINGDKADVEKA